MWALRSSHKNLCDGRCFCDRSKSMSDVTAEDVQNLRQLRYEEMQKIKSQLKEQDQKWQDVSTGGEGDHGALPASLKEIKVLLRDIFPWHFSIQYYRKCTVVCLKDHSKNIEICLFSKRLWALKSRKFLPSRIVNLLTQESGVWLLIMPLLAKQHWSKLRLKGNRI